MGALSMKTKRWLIVLILTSSLSGSVVNAQETGIQPIYPPPPPITPEATPYRPTVPANGGLSDWILYKRDCCEGKHGVYTPLYTEIYVNSGPSVPVGGMTLSRELKTGWSITGGARVLFFNEPHNRAWVVDLHIMNTNEGGGGAGNTQFPVTFFQNGVRSDQIVFQGVAGRTTFSVQGMNRTSVGLGLGRQWYLREAANSDGCNWRFGIDAGGRYGSERVAFNEFGHVVDVVGTTYAAAHTDVEFPCRNFIFHAGVRFEWAYTWSDVLQRTSDSQDLSFLLTIGVRF